MASSSMETAKDVESQPGFYFLPSDYELMLYLRFKILGKNWPAAVIPTTDVYTCNPYQIPFHEFKYRTKYEWYFFTTRPKGALVVKDGYWRPRLITPIEYVGECIGCKRVIDFYWGASPGRKDSDWFIHEYSLHPDTLRYFQHVYKIAEKMENFVVCKISNQGSASGRLREI